MEVLLLIKKIMAEYYANNGDVVFVIARGKKDEEYIENNVHVIRVGAENDTSNVDSFIDYRRKVAKVLLRLQKNNNIDIIETPDWGANTIYFERYRHIPLVVRLHTPLKIWLDYNNNDFGSSKDIMLKWEHSMLRRADSITSCSQLLKDMVVKQYNLNRHITVIPNPYNNEDFRVVSKEDNNNLIYVGSLEERKGVILLAEALNKVLDSIDDNYVYIIGKDTMRNNKNISTKEYMLKIIDKKYHHRIKFIGQISNNKINEYLNKAYLAIFPSVFDNYPYTILEAMASGKYIVCSDNIGSVDLIKKYNYVFKTGNSDDLADKILMSLNNKKDFINYKNIEQVNEICNKKRVCEQIKKIYTDAIESYNNNEAISALNKVVKYNNFYKIQKVPGNLANVVYLAFTDVGNFVIKKYNYNYNFEICNELYNCYEANNIKFIKPINNKVISINGNKYNIFNYLESSDGELKSDDVKKLININRKTTRKANIVAKCNKYYNFLNNLLQYKESIKIDEIFLLNEYKKIKNISLFTEQYLNHGDLSLNNILFYKNELYVIDFDETIVTTKLYDYAVMFIKIFLDNIDLNYQSIKCYIINNRPDKEYSFYEYFLTIKFYLCKILLEKFYLYETGYINLFSKTQLKDDYKKYLYILNIMNESDNENE